MKQNNTQFNIKFSIKGKDFNPDDFTLYLNMIPSNQYKKGEEIPLSKNLIRIKSKLLREESAWVYETKFIKTLHFDEVSLAFLSELNDKLEKIIDYSNRNNVTINVDVIVEIAEDEIPSLLIPKEMIRFLSKLNTEIDFDIYLV